MDVVHCVSLFRSTGRLTRIQIQKACRVTNVTPTSYVHATCVGIQKTCNRCRLPCIWVQKKCRRRRVTESRLRRRVTDIVPRAYRLRRRVKNIHQRHTARVGIQKTCNTCRLLCVEIQKKCQRRRVKRIQKTCRKRPATRAFLLRRRVIDVDQQIRISVSKL